MRRRPPRSTRTDPLFPYTTLFRSVISSLKDTGHVQGEALAIAMRPFADGGTYGRFFKGQSTLKIGASLTVFELSDLSAREELRSVVLAAIMFLSAQAMRKDRSEERRVGKECVGTFRSRCAP